MTLQETLKEQAEEHSKMEEAIIKNVASRKWTRDQLRTELAFLYVMGIRHGIEDARAASRTVD